MGVHSNFELGAQGSALRLFQGVANEISDIQLQLGVSSVHNEVTTDALRGAEDFLRSAADVQAMVEEKAQAINSIYDISYLLSLLEPLNRAGFTVSRPRFSLKAAPLISVNGRLLILAVDNLAHFLRINDCKGVIRIKIDHELSEMSMGIRFKSLSHEMKVAFGRWDHRGFGYRQIIEDGTRPQYPHRLALAYLSIGLAGGEMRFDERDGAIVLVLPCSQQMRLDL